MNKAIIEAVRELNEEKVINLTKYLLYHGTDPLEVIQSIQEGMIEVGDLYADKKYFIADLIMSGVIFKDVLCLREMRDAMYEKNLSVKKYSILIGTVSEDLHDIGKEIFVGMAQASGFQTYDIGVNASAKTFYDTYMEYKPDIVAMSGVLTQSIKYMKEVVDLFKEKGIRDQTKIIIGGGPVSEEICEFVGADAYSIEVRSGIDICLQWVSEKQRGGVEE